MQIAVFAGKVFQVNSQKVHTLNALQYTSELLTEKQDAEGKKPSTFNKGPGLDTMNFMVKLDAALGVDPRSEWDSWIDIMNKGIAYPFILGSRPLGKNNLLLVNVNKSNSIIDNKGNIVYLELILQFDEYVRPGSKKEMKISKGASAPGISSNSNSNLENLLLGTENKSEQKRQNPSMVRAGYEPRGDVWWNT